MAEQLAVLINDKNGYFLAESAPSGVRLTDSDAEVNTPEGVHQPDEPMAYIGYKPCGHFTQKSSRHCDRGRRCHSKR